MIQQLVIVNTFVALSALIVFGGAHPSDAAAPSGSSLPSSTPASRPVMSLSEVQGTVGGPPTSGVIGALSQLEATIVLRTSCSLANGKSEEVSVSYGLSGGRVTDSDFLVRTKDKASWKKEFAGMGPNREEDRFTHVVLAGKLEFVVFLEDSGVHAMMWETSDPTELSKTFHDIPIRHRTKASELIEALVKGRFRFEVLFGGNERLALGSPQGALAEGSVKFSDGKVTDAEFIIPRKSLEAEGRKRLMTELLGEKAATQMDLSERIPPGEANTKGRFGLVRNQWNTREDTYWIELSPCREDDAELESQLQALIEFLQKPTASAPSISEIRARIDALEKTVASMPSSRPGVEATKKRLERLKKLFDLQPPSPE